MAGSGAGVEAGFYHREILEFEGETGLFERLLKDRHIIDAEAEEGGHLCAAALRVSVDVASYNLIVWKVDHRGELCETRLDGGVVGGHIALAGIAVVGGSVIFRYQPSRSFWVSAS